MRTMTTTFTAATIRRSEPTHSPQEEDDQTRQQKPQSQFDSVRLNATSPSCPSTCALSTSCCGSHDRFNAYEYRVANPRCYTTTCQKHSPEPAARHAWIPQVAGEALPSRTRGWSLLAEHLRPRFLRFPSRLQDLGHMTVSLTHVKLDKVPGTLGVIRCKQAR